MLKIEQVHSVVNPHVAKIELGDRSLFELSQNFAVTKVGDRTPENSAECGMFDNFGILEVVDAPVEKFGVGPHFITVERDFVPRIEFDKLVAKRLQVQTPAAFIGKTSCESTKNNRNARSRLQDLRIATNLEQRVLKGILIGTVCFDSKYKTHIGKLYAESYCAPLVIVPSHCRFANLHTAQMKKTFRNPYTVAEAENSILLFQTRPAAKSPLQLTYQIELVSKLIIIGQLTLLELEDRVDQVYEDITGDSPDDFDFEDLEGDGVESEEDSM